MRIAPCAAVLLFAAGCSDNSDGAGLSMPTGAADAAPTDAGGTDMGPFGGGRPVSVHVPPRYVQGVPAPLVIMLHGYSASGAIEESYLKLTALSDARGFLYAYPDGTVDALGFRFWNATDACCDTRNLMVDDSAYLSGLIDEIESRYTVDPKKVFVVGHSNGGFMSYRMACDHGNQIAAIVSIAGAMFADVSRCEAKEPVSVLEIHGTADAVINYQGGAIQGRAYPGATTTVGDWAAIDGCASTPDGSAPSLDLDSSLTGNETSVATYAAGCKAGGHAELWTIQGGSHIPTLSTTFSSAAIDFLFTHARP